jgi:hypothetical protein
MRHLRTISLAAFVIAALVACVGAGSASATALCKVDSEVESMCPEASLYPAETELSATLKAGTVSKLSAGFGTVECKEAKIGGKTIAKGGTEETVKVGGSAFTFGKCNATVSTVETPDFTLHYRIGFGGTRGYLTMDFVKFSVTSGEVSCTYGAAEIKGESLMAVKGEPGELRAEAVEFPLVEGSFLCASPAKWTATYTVNAPNPISVSAG